MEGIQNSTKARRLFNIIIRVKRKWLVSIYLIEVLQRIETMFKTVLKCYMAARTLSRHNMNRQSLPPLYPIQEKNRISCMDTAHIDSMQHTRTWKKTYTGNDRQLQSSHKIYCIFK